MRTLCSKQTRFDDSHIKMAGAGPFAYAPLTRLTPTPKIELRFIIKQEDHRPSADDNNLLTSQITDHGHASNHPDTYYFVKETIAAM